MAILKDIVQGIDRICTSFHIDSLTPQIRACDEALQDGGIVDVVVLGQFKAGKSSFMNSLIGSDLMPVAVLPATAVVTRTFHGEKDRAVVHYISNKFKEIGIDEIADFVTEQKNPNNEKHVSIVDVELSRLDKYRGIRFVDTPGLGSAFIHNTQTSLDWLPKVGAAIIAVSVDHPLSEQDLQLLRELRKYTPEIAVLLTKADIVSPNQLSDVIEFTREQLVKHVGNDSKIFPYSVKPGFDNLRNDFLEQYLLRRIADRHAEQFDEILKYKTKSLITGCMEYLSLSMKAASAAEEARIELSAQLEREKEDLATVSNEIFLLSTDMKTRLREAASDRFMTFYSEITRLLQGELKKEFPLWKQNLRDITETFTKWFNTVLVRELDRLSQTEGPALMDYLTKADASFTRVVRAFQDRLSREIEKALNMSFKGAKFEAVIQKPSRPDVRLSRIFDIPFELLWFIIPMFIFRPLVRRYFMKTVPWEVEKNIHRIAAQWAEAINISIDDLARQSKDFIRNEINTVENLVSSSDSRREEIQKALDELSTFQAASASSN